MGPLPPTGVDKDPSLGASSKPKRRREHMNLFDLTPDEFMAYHYIQTREFRGESYVRTSDLAPILKCTDRTARRVVASLILKGYIVRLARSLYSLVPFEDTSDRNGHSKASKLEELPSNTSNEVLQGAEIRPTSIGGIEVKYYDDDSNLGGVGLVEPKVPSVTKKTATTKYHRTVPRSQWTMQHVGKEFRLRLAQLNRGQIDSWRSPVIGAANEATRLVQALYKWQSEYGITPEEAATLMDEFFESDDIQRMSNEFPPYRLYLQYVKVNIDKLRTRAVTSTVMTEIEEQVIPW